MSLTSVFHSENLISVSQRVEIKYQHKPEVSPMEQNCFIKINIQYKESENRKKYIYKT